MRLEEVGVKEVENSGYLGKGGEVEVVKVREGIVVGVGDGLIMELTGLS